MRLFAQTLCLDWEGAVNEMQGNSDKEWTKGRKNAPRLDN